jgi:hypothetical protein
MGHVSDTQAGWGGMTLPTASIRSRPLDRDRADTGARAAPLAGKRTGDMTSRALLVRINNYPTRVLSVIPFWRYGSRRRRRS